LGLEWLRKQRQKKDAGPTYRGLGGGSGKGGVASTVNVRSECAGYNRRVSRGKKEEMAAGHGGKEGR